MEEILLIDATERYVNGEMGAEELAYFEGLRASNQEVDQLVSEYIFFLHEMNQHGDIKKLKHIMSDTIIKLTEEGHINTRQFTTQAKIVKIWSKYKKTTAVAASIAIIVSVISATIVSSISRNKENNIKPLVEKLKEQDNKYKKLEHQIGSLKNQEQTPAKPRVESKFRATGFLIDADLNIIITNAHVINEAKNQLIVEKGNGDQFTAETVMVIPEKDIAILKITDENFKKLPAVPFSLKKNNTDLGESVFTLGFPKQEIVYGEGYLSALNGYQMDTVFYQLSTLANEGNSGSPVLNKNGELIGVISSKEANAEGVVYAIKSQNILSALNELKKVDAYQNIKTPVNSKLQRTDRTTQIKKLQDYVFMIKGN